MLQTNVLNKTKTHGVSTFFQRSAIEEILLENIIEQEKSQITVWRVRIACWIPKACNTFFCNIL